MNTWLQTLIWKVYVKNQLKKIKNRNMYKQNDGVSSFSVVENNIKNMWYKKLLEEFYWMTSQKKGKIFF